MNRHPGPAGQPQWWSSLLSTTLLLLGGLGGAVLLTLLHIPAGALIGAVLGSMSVNKVTDALSQRKSHNRGAADRVRGLPGAVRVTGQVLLGVMAGAQLSQETLVVLLDTLLPVVAAVVAMLGCTILLALYLFRRHQVDPLTAVMAAAPGGISELAISAARQGAKMHIVLAIHLFRVLVVVLVVLPLLLFFLRT